MSKRNNLSVLNQMMTLEAVWYYFENTSIHGFGNIVRTNNLGIKVNTQFTT